MRPRQVSPPECSTEDELKGVMIIPGVNFPTPKSAAMQIIYEEGNTEEPKTIELRPHINLFKEYYTVQYGRANRHRLVVAPELAAIRKTVGSG